MRVLFYGGCHAGVFRNVFNRFTLEPDFSSDLLTNYLIIDQGKPFPYEIVPNYDAVVFSPIRNKGEYNTPKLAELCREHKIKAVTFTWLQWNGYHCGAIKLPQTDWVYPRLITDRVRFPTFNDYRAWAERPFTDGELDENMERTSRHLREGEAELQTDVQIADFVLDNYKKNLLFWVPDHPTNYLYNYAIKEIARHLDIKMDPALDSTLTEFHREHRIPILPQTLERYDIDLPCGDYGFFPRLGQRWYNMREWLEMCYNTTTDSFVATCKSDGQLIANGNHYTLAPQQLVFCRPAVGGTTFEIIHGPDFLMKALPEPRIVQGIVGEWEFHPLQPYAEASVSTDCRKDVFRPTKLAAESTE